MKQLPVRPIHRVAQFLAVLALAVGAALVSMRGDGPCDVSKGSPRTAPAAEDAGFQPVSGRRYVLSGDGGTLVRLDAKRLVVLDASTGEEVRRCELPGLEPRCVACSPSGDRILAGYPFRDAVVLWETGRPVALGEHPRVICCALAADSGLAAAGGQDGRVQIWDVATRRKRHALQFDRSVMCLAFSASGQELLVGGAHGLLAVCLLNEGPIVRRLAGHERIVHSVAFSPDGRRALSGGEDGTFRVWDLERGEESWRETPSPYPIHRVAWSPDGRAIACGGVEQIVDVYDVERRQPLASFSHAAPISSLAFLPDGKSVMSAGFARPPATWERTTGRRLPTDTTEAPEP